MIAEPPDEQRVQALVMVGVDEVFYRRHDCYLTTVVDFARFLRRLPNVSHDELRRVYGLELELEGRRPVCVLTRDAAIPALANIAVALVTTRVRGLPSEVSVGPDDGQHERC